MAPLHQCLALVVLCVLAGAADAASKKRIYVGGLFQASRTESTIRAFLMAIADLNSGVVKLYATGPEGGMLKEYPIGDREFVPLLGDTRGDTYHGFSAAQELLSWRSPVGGGGSEDAGGGEVAAVVGPSKSGVSQTVHLAMKKAGALMVSFGSTSTELQSSVYSNFYRVVWSDSAQVRKSRSIVARGSVMTTLPYVSRWEPTTAHWPEPIHGNLSDSLTQTNPRPLPRITQLHTYQAKAVAALLQSINVPCVAMVSTSQSYSSNLAARIVRHLGESTIYKFDAPRRQYKQGNIKVEANVRFQQVAGEGGMTQGEWDNLREQLKDVKERGIQVIVAPVSALDAKYLYVHPAALISPTRHSTLHSVAHKLDRCGRTCVRCLPFAHLNTHILYCPPPTPYRFQVAKNLSMTQSKFVRHSYP